MIVHVWRRAVAAEIGPVVVACGDRAIADAVEAAGGRAVMTDPQLPTGSDRIHQAIAYLDPDCSFDAVINVQGDLPLLDPAAVRVAFTGLIEPVRLGVQVDTPADLERARQLVQSAR